MPIHMVTSPGWGELHVEALSEPDKFGRPWRATLLNRPARLGHIVAVHGDDEVDVVERMLRYVEDFDPQPQQPRRPERPI